MGLSTSASVIIILFGLAVALSVAYPNVERDVLGISDAFRVQNQNNLERLETSLEISSIEVNGDCSGYDLTIKVTNDGRTGVNMGDVNLFDNGEPNAISNLTTSLKLYSTSVSDGEIIAESGIPTTAIGDANVSWLGQNSSNEYESRTYFSFDTTRVPDDRQILDLQLYYYIGKFYQKEPSGDLWITDHGYGNDLIGDSLKIEVWGIFNSMGKLDHVMTIGWRNFTVPTNVLEIGRDLDFELVSLWDAHYNEYAEIYQTEADGTTFDPYLLVTYQNADPSEVILAPTKDINIVYNDITSSRSIHTVKIITENGAVAYGTYMCDGGK